MPDKYYYCYCYHMIAFTLTRTMILGALLNLYTHCNNTNISRCSSNHKYVCTIIAIEKLFFRKQ